MCECLSSRSDFDIDVYYNRFLIDAKSILGVLSLDLTRELTVDCHGESHKLIVNIEEILAVA